MTKIASLTDDETAYAVNQWCRGMTQRQITLALRRRNKWAVQKAIDLFVYRYSVDAWAETGRGTKEWRALVGVALADFIERGGQVPTAPP